MLQKLHNLLKEWELAVQQSDGQRLLTTLMGMDAFLRQNRATLNSELIHYLERRSYQKALESLEANYLKTFGQ